MNSIPCFFHTQAPSSSPSSLGGGNTPVGRVRIRIKSTILIIVLSCITFSAHASTLKASWYSLSSLKSEGTTKFSNNIMANGQRFNENALTAATRLYPLGTTLKITNLKNKKSVVVKVTDRISKRFATSRIDLSKAAFKEIAELKQGLVEIGVEEI